MAASKEEIDRAAGAVSLVLAAEGRVLWPEDEQTLRAAVNVLMKLGARNIYR